MSIRPPSGGGGGTDEAEVQALIDATVAGYIPKSLADASTVIGATVDNTPTALDAGELGALVSGTEFPGAPVDRQVFFRTDRDIHYFYDLANTRWLSVQEYVVPFQATDEAVDASIADAAQNAGRLAVPHKGTYSLLITRFYVATKVLTTNSVASHWTVKLNWATVGDVDTQMGTTMDTSADGTTNWAEHVIAPNAVLDSTAVQLKCRVDKAGATATPGGLNIISLLHFRLVG